MNIPFQWILLNTGRRDRKCKTHSHILYPYDRLKPGAHQESWYDFLTIDGMESDTEDGIFESLYVVLSIFQVPYKHEHQNHSQLQYVYAQYCVLANMAPTASSTFGFPFSTVDDRVQTFQDTKEKKGTDSKEDAGGSKVCRNSRWCLL